MSTVIGKVFTAGLVIAVLVIVVAGFFAQPQTVPMPEDLLVTKTTVLDASG